MRGTTFFQRVGALCWPFGPARQSILRVLTWWYVVSVAAILCLFSGALYTTVSASLLRDVDKALLLRANSIESAIFAFWRAERSADVAAPGNWAGAPSQTLLDEVEKGRFLDLVSRWMARTGQLNLGEPVRLLNRQGELIGSSPEFRALALPLEPEAVSEGMRGRSVVQTLRRRPAGPARLLTRPVRAGDSVLYLIQMAASLEDRADALRRLRRGLLLLVPFTLLVTTSAGWILATSSLRPIDVMVAQARQIGVGNLHERVDVPPSGDALQRLAVTFNDLLGRLERAFRRMRQFSAAASHELRTPLTVLKGELEVALRKPRPPEEYQHVLRTQLETIDGMTHTVATLLTLARSEAAEEAVDWRPVDLRQLAQEVVAAWRVPAETKRVALVLEADGPCPIVGERHLLERLLSNLLDNAIKFTPAPGRVALTVRADATHARVVVEDTGPGIAAEDLPSVFDRFFTPRSPTAASHSTGLGLGLCRWIVEAHQGRIHIDSVVGQGTVVTVALPLQT